MLRNVLILPNRPTPMEKTSLCGIPAILQPWAHVVTNSLARDLSEQWDKASMVEVCGGFG